MSVTFGPQIDPTEDRVLDILRWDIDAGQFLPVPGAPDLAGMAPVAARDAAEAWLAAQGCPDYASRDLEGYMVRWRFPAADGIPTANLSNANARVLLRVLGIDAEDLVGAMPAPEMIDRAAVAIRDGRWHDRLEDLLMVAVACQRAGRPIAWG